MNAAEKRGLSEWQHQVENRRPALSNVLDISSLEPCKVKYFNKLALDDVSPSTFEVSPTFEDVSSTFEDAMIYYAQGYRWLVHLYFLEILVGVILRCYHGEQGRVETGWYPYDVQCPVALKELIAGSAVSKTLLQDM